MASYPRNSVQFRTNVPNSNSNSKTLQAAAVINLIVDGCTWNLLCEFAFWIDSKLFCEGISSCYQLDPLVLIKPIRFSDWVLIRVLFYCWLLLGKTNSSKKTKKNLNKSRLTWSLVRLLCAWNCLWSDRPRPKWPLIRPPQTQVPDNCPDKSALEAFSRPSNSSAPRTCVRSKMVWSELNSVWPPRPGCWNALIFQKVRRKNLI